MTAPETGRGFWARMKEEWRLGRPFARPRLDESPVEWLGPARSARRALIVKTMAASIVLATLLAATIGGVSWSRSRAEARRREGLSAEVARLERFVEGVRGLTFSKRVPVRLLSASEYDSESGSSIFLRDYFVSLYPVFRALGLSTGPSDPSSIADLASHAELGFYDQATESISVRGESVTPLIRRVLVHELTHALDDQNFSFTHLDALSRGYRNLAVLALIEGDARRVENAYVQSLSRAEQLLSAAGIRSLTGTIPGVPEDLTQLLFFPYEAGATFVARLESEGGNTAIDDVFHMPPFLTYEVLHPAVYEDVRRRDALYETTLRLPRPAPVGSVFGAPSSFILGELVTRLFLAQGIGATAADRVADVWNGDWAVHWYNGSTECARVWYGKPLTASGTTLLTAALRAWVAKQRHATFEPAHLGLTSCV